MLFSAVTSEHAQGGSANVAAAGHTLLPQAHFIAPIFTAGPRCQRDTTLTTPTLFVTDVTNTFTEGPWNTSNGSKIVWERADSTF